MKYKVGDLVSYKYDSLEMEFLGIVTKVGSPFANMYLVYLFDSKTNYGYSEDSLCPVSTK